MLSLVRRANQGAAAVCVALALTLTVSGGSAVAQTVASAARAASQSRAMTLASFLGDSPARLRIANRGKGEVQIAQLSQNRADDANPSTQSSYSASTTLSAESSSAVKFALDGSAWTIRGVQVMVRSTAGQPWRAVSTPTNATALAVDSVGNRVWIATTSGIGYLPIIGAGEFQPVNDVSATHVAVQPDDGRLAFVADGSLWVLGAESGATVQRLTPVREVAAIRFDLASKQLIVSGNRATELLSLPCCDVVTQDITSVNPSSPTPDAVLEYLPRSVLTLLEPVIGRPDLLRLSIDVQCSGLNRCDESDRYLRTLSISTDSGGQTVPVELVGVDPAGVVTLKLPFVPTDATRVNVWAVDLFGRTSNLLTMPSPQQATDRLKANALPTVALTVPTANQVFSLPITVVLKATASDTDGTLSKVEFFRAGTTLIGTGTLSAGVYSYSWTTATAGSYSITAKATDNAGGTKTTPAVAMIVNTAPTVTLDLPAAAATFTAQATVALRAVAADSDGTISKVEFFNGATLISAGTLSAGKYTANWTGVAAGTYSVTAKATDNRRAATSSTAASITVCGAPMIAWSAPATGSVTNLATPVATGVTISLSATASVPAACRTVGKVEFYNGTTLLGTGTLAAGVYRYSWANVASGTYSVKARAYLNATTTSADSAVISLIVNRPPSVTLDVPLTGASFTAPATVALSATASDADGTLSKVEFLNGNTVVATGTLTAGKYSASWTNVAAGSYSLTARATDNRNAVTTSTAASVTVASCTAPTVAWVSPTTGSIVNLAAPLDTGMTVPLVATASLSAACGGIGKVDFYRGTTLLGTGTLVGSQYAYNWANVAPGSYNVKARAYRGTTTSFTDSAVISLVVNRPPEATLDMQFNGAALVAPGSLPLRVTVYDRDGSIALVEFVSGGTVVATGIVDGLTASATWGNVPIGTYAVAARVTDNRGAVTVTPPLTFSVVAETNLAQGKTARQSTDFSSGAASRAVDGSTSTAATTAVEDYPWWEVDLGQGYWVSRVEITPQGVTGALDDFWLIFSAAPIATLAGDDLVLQQQYGDLSNAADAFAIPVVGASGTPISVAVRDPRPCCSSKNPRYVRLWSRKPGVQLTLAEVKVAGLAGSGGYSERAVGAILTGVTDGQSIDGAATLALGVTPKRETNDNSTFTVARVAYYDGQIKLGETTAAPFSYGYPAAVGDYRFRARVEWADGAAAWTDAANVRVQSPADTSLRVAWPKEGGEAFVGDSGIPNYFTLRGSWAADPTATLEYIIDCVPTCFGTPTWRPIRYRKGATFAALVRYPFVGGATQLTVRATALSGAVQTSTINFAKRSASLYMTQPNFVDAAGQTVTGMVRGVDRASPTSTANFYLEQVYYRDGQIGTLSAPCAGSGVRGPWQYGSCGDSAGVQVLRQFYAAPGPLQLALAADNTFTRAATGFASNPTFGEGGGSVAVVPFTGEPRGWFYAYATGNIVVPGYKPFPSYEPYPVLLRYGSLAPEIQDSAADQALWQGDLPLSTVFVDYDESRVLPAANVTWRANGLAIATATSCNVMSDGSGPLEHKFRCTGTWPAAPVGSFPVEVRVTDLQNLTTIKSLGTWTVQPWTASIVAPADNAPFAAGTLFNVTASVPVTAPAVASVQLLEDGSVVATKTTQNGAVSFSRAPSVGTHTYQVLAVSPTNSQTRSQSISVRVINGQPPAVTITSPTATTDFTAPASVPITVNASSPAGTIAQVILRRNGVEITRLTAAPYTYTWNGVAAGQYTLTAEAINNQGLSTLSSAVAIGVFAAAPASPTIALNFPAGVTGFSSNDQLNDWACLQLAASSSDSTIVRTRVFVDGVDTLSLQDDPFTPRATSSRNVCLSGLSTGLHTLKARAETARGAMSDSATMNVTIAATEVGITQPATRAYYTTDFAPARVQGQALPMVVQVISGIASPARAEFYESSYDIQYGRASLASSGGLPLTAIWTTPPSGFRNLVGCVIDTVGIRSCKTSTAAIPFVQASNAIAATLAGPTAAAAGAQVSYTVTLTVGSSTTAQKLGLFDADTGELLIEKVAPLTNTTDFTLSIPLARKLIAVAYAASGYEFVSNVLAVTSNNLAPIVEIARPVTGSEFPAGATVPIIVNGADPDGAASRVELWQVGENGNADNLLASASAATLTYAMVMPNSTQTIQLYAYVIDNYGAKVKSSTTSIMVRADITDPRYFVWTNMNAALKAGYKASALEFLTPTAQLNYAELFDDSIPQIAAIAASYIPAFVQIELTESTADYLVARTINGQRLIFGLRFVLMDDGSWKLESM